MYTLVKKSEFNYGILVRDREIGLVNMKEKNWTASIGKVVFSSPTRKKAVENVLFQIVMAYVSKEYKEKIG